MRMPTARWLALGTPLVLLAAACNLGEPPVDYPSPSELVELADLNGDGSLDLVAAGGVRYEVLLNDGSGALVGMPVTVEADIASTALGDVDGDGNIDRVDLSHSGSGPTLLLSLGDGTGGFAEPVVAMDDLGALSANAVDLIDVDGDGQLEIVTAARYGIQVFTNDGTGQFERTYNTGVQYGSPGAGGYWSVTGSEITHVDFDADGDEDVILRAFVEWPETPQPAVVVLRNDGLGGYENWGLDLRSTFGDPMLRSGLTVADLDEDGYLDIVVGDQGSASLGFYRGTGAGGWDRNEVTITTSLPPSALDATDIDGDGHLDLIVGSATSTAAEVLYGDGTGAFPEAHELGTGGAVSAVATGHLDGDTTPDVVFGVDGDTADSSVAVLLNTLGRRQHRGRQHLAR